MAVNRLLQIILVQCLGNPRIQEEGGVMDQNGLLEFYLLDPPVVEVDFHPTRLIRRYRQFRVLWNLRLLLPLLGPLL